LAPAKQALTKKIFFNSPHPSLGGISSNFFLIFYGTSARKSMGSPRGLSLKGRRGEQEAVEELAAAKPMLQLK
jgi:hypothetical protein